MAPRSKRKRTAERSTARKRRRTVKKMVPANRKRQTGKFSGKPDHSFVYTHVQTLSHDFFPAGFLGDAEAFDINGIPAISADADEWNEYRVTNVVTRLVCTKAPAGHPTVNLVQYPENNDGASMLSPHSFATIQEYSGFKWNRHNIINEPNVGTDSGNAADRAGLSVIRYKPQVLANAQRSVNKGGWISCVSGKVISQFGPKWGFIVPFAAIPGASLGVINYEIRRDITVEYRGARPL